MFKRTKLLFLLFSPQHRDEEDDGETVEFYVRICFDVLLEVLHPGDMRPLTKLERVGRRFHWTIEKFFPDFPFLRLDLELEPAAAG